jgi:thiamine-phosphate pyrophosphorylase
LLLYYITDRSQFPGGEEDRRRALLNKVAEAAACGVDFIQIREKDLVTHELELLAQDATRSIRARTPYGNDKGPRTRLLINSRVDVAIACGTDGVHLRSDDISVRDARSVWTLDADVRARESGPFIAVSCHTAAEVSRAAADVADFVVFAPVFEKKGVPSVSAAGLVALHDACQHGIPVLALGGITVANARACVEAGAAGVAGIRLFQEPDIAETVRVLRS